VSEVPQQRPQAGAAGAKQQTWSAVRDARSAWANATRAHEQAPPDAGFRDRLRALSDAAAAMRDAHARALEAGLAWRPIEGSERARPPYELRPGTGRRGPEELWTRFDAAVEQLNTAGAGDSLAAIVTACAAVAHAAGALADALETASEAVNTAAALPPNP
jgi:sugar (pentulose or hexulose) kinase